MKQWQGEVDGGSGSEMSVGAASLSQPPIAQLGQLFVALRDCSLQVLYLVLQLHVLRHSLQSSSQSIHLLARACRPARRVLGNVSICELPHRIALRLQPHGGLAGLDKQLAQGQQLVATPHGAGGSTCMCKHMSQCAAVCC